MFVFQRAGGEFLLRRSRDAEPSCRRQERERERERELVCRGSESQERLEWAERRAGALDARDRA